MVRSPVTFSLALPADSTRFDLKVNVGYFATSRKSGLRRWLSRISTRVSTDAASMVTSMDVFDRSDGSYSTLPLTFVKAPRTVEMPMWRTENCAELCGGSICQVSARTAEGIARRTTLARPSKERDKVDSPPFRLPHGVLLYGGHVAQL